MSVKKRWIPLESNPDVINSYLFSLGFPSSLYSFTDVYCFEPWALSSLPQPVLGFILLYKITPASSQAFSVRQSSSPAPPPDLFFMKQTIPNACGTIALMHVIGNCLYSEEIPLIVPSYLDTFFASCLEMTPEQRGLELENGRGFEEIEAAHKAAAEDGQSRVPSASEKTSLHFVAIVPKDGGIYELDGRAEQPIYHGQYENFVNDVCERVILGQFIKADPENPRFTVLAFGPNTSY
jgi:ubiquitin carboxyl-terminal hydrolase L3